MDSILVRGNGALNGVIPIAGAKNACLTLMPATLLTEEPLTLTNAPRLSDIRTMTQLLQSLGAEVASLQDGLVLAMSSHDIDNHRADYEVLFADLKSQNRMPEKIVHLWNVSASDGRPEHGLERHVGSEHSGLGRWRGHLDDLHCQHAQ